MIPTIALHLSERVLVMKKRGRPSKYETHIEPHLEEIKKMALDMTEEQIAKALDVSYTTFKKAKSQYPALSDCLKKGRSDLVSDLKSTLIRKAKGFQYTEKKTIKESGMVGREEIYEKASLPDVAAINLLLKNYDKDNWANDPQALKLREKELELQERKIELNEW